jgi:hypothetical protein
MRNPTLLQRVLLPLLAASAVAVGCGGSNSSTTPDSYNGVVTFDTSGQSLDLKFQPIPSGTTIATALQNLCDKPPSDADLKVTTRPCYPAQVGYAKGKMVKFYNVLNTGTAVRTTPTGSAPPLFPMPAASFPAAYNFPGTCTKGPTFDPVNDAFRRDTQYPILSVLPLPTTAFGVNVLPIYNAYSVSAAGNTCNDLKYEDSILAGNFGAKRSDQPAALQLWAPIDMTVNIMALGTSLAAPVATAWYDGLQLNYLDGGRIPVDPDGNVVAMDGVILNGASFANAYDNKAVLLPAVPGDDSYSPVVRLRQFSMPSGKAPGDFVGICPTGATNCPSNYVKMESTTASFNTIFIVSIPQ